MRARQGVSRVGILRRERPLPAGRALGRHLLVFALAALLLSPGAAAPSVVEAAGAHVLSSVSLSSTRPTPYPGEPFTVVALLTSPYRWPFGDVEFFLVRDGVERSLGIARTAKVDELTSQARLWMKQGLPPGQQTFIARFPGDANHQAATSEAMTLTIPQIVPDIWLEAPTSIQANRDVTLHAFLDPRGFRRYDRATHMTFRRQGATEPLCVLPVTVPSPTVCTVRDLPVGSHGFTVTYSGTNAFATVTSLVWTTVVTPDIVEATNVTREWSTFYPIEDGYRDVLGITGVRGEPLRGEIVIRDPGGTVVRRHTLARATGAYRYGWDGRSSTGNVLPSGKYAISQRLVDDFGNEETWSSAVNLSGKRLVEKTTYVTKNGDAFQARGDAGPGSITTSASGDYAKLVGDFPEGWVGVGYEFTLPEAIQYHSVSFQIRTKSFLKIFVGLDGNTIGIQDFSRCEYDPESWGDDCFERRDRIGTQDGQVVWEKTTGSSARNIHGRKVRGIVSVYDGTVYVYKARVRVDYTALE